jgi:DNA-binding CsgD family transcriptional regulator
MATLGVALADIMSDYLEVWGPVRPTLVPLGDRPIVVIGRDAAADVALADDGEVSRRHAMIERLSVGWSIRDLSSRNGTFVRGERLAGSRPLEDRDELRVGRTRIVFCTGEPASRLPATATAAPAPELTRRERDVLLALFGPARTGEMFTEPASTREMAAALFVSEAAVKQHLANLYDKFGIYDGDRRRVRLANEALRRGAVRLADLRKG